MLPGTVAMGALEAGPNVIRSTLLSSPQYTNITSGQKVIINKAGDDTVVLTTSMGTRCTVTKSDIPYSGGLIHIVDNLLVPPAQLRATSDAFQIPNFLGALFAADIMPDLAVRKNITVFAPLDKAMREVGGSLLDIEDDKDGKAALRRIMGYHIVHDQVLVSSDLTNGSTLSTLAPGPAGSNDTLDLTVHVAGNNKYINSAQIVQPDILLANGIMHIVSDVVNPDADVQPDPQANTQPVLFPVSSVEAPFTSDLPCTVSCPVTSTAEPTTTADATSTFLATHTNTGLAPQATGHFAGVAVGALGLGAGMAWL